MEQELRQNLLDLADAYAAAKDISLPALGKLMRNDNTLFSRLKEAETGFNIRTFDEVVDWFSANWPADAKWPKRVARPKQREAAE